MKRYTKEQRKEAEKIGLTYNIIYSRLKTGWSDEDAITLPIGKKVKKKTIIAGIEVSDDQLQRMKQNNLSLGNVGVRIRNGMTLDEAINTPNMRDENHILYSGKIVKRKEIDEARAKGVSEYALKKYIKKGMRVKDIVKMYLAEQSNKPNITQHHVEIGKRNGVSRATIRVRVNKGWTIEEAITVPAHKYTLSNKMPVSEQLEILGRMKYLNRVKNDNYNPIMLERLNLTWDDVTEIPVEIENSYATDELG